MVLINQVTFVDTIKSNYVNSFRVLIDSRKPKIEKYTLTSIMSPSVMSLPLLYPESLGNGCAQFKSPPLLPHYPLIHHSL
jgi:hypothetical protein